MLAATVQLEHPVPPTICRVQTISSILGFVVLSKAALSVWEAP